MKYAFCLPSCSIWMLCVTLVYIHQADQRSTPQAVIQTSPPQTVIQQSAAYTSKGPRLPENRERHSPSSPTKPKRLARTFSRKFKATALSLRYQIVAPRHKEKSLEERQDSSGIPQFVFCTSNGEAALPPSWHLLNPKFVIHHFNDAEVETFVQKHRPQLFPAFKNLQPVERADLFRYLVLYVHGGVYTDMDTTCKVPIGKWASEFGYTGTMDAADFIIGVEFKKGPRSVPDLPFQLLQWTIASAPKNPILDKVLDHCLSRIQEITEAKEIGVLLRTGPWAWTQAILATIERFGSPTGHTLDAQGRKHPRALLPVPQLMRDGQLLPLTIDGRVWRILILPYRAFGFHPAHKNPPEDLLNHLVEHMFIGSWRGHQH